MTDLLRTLREAFRRFGNGRPAAPQAPKWRFTVVLEEDELDGGWIASVVELPGCMSQGDTEEEALENVVDAIGGVIQARMSASLSQELRHRGPGPRQRPGAHRHVVAI